MTESSPDEATRGAHRAPTSDLDPTAATSHDLPPEVEQAWLRPRGEKRYPGATWPQRDSDGRRGRPATPAAEASPPPAVRPRGRRANPIVAPEAVAAERLAADKLAAEKLAADKRAVDKLAADRATVAAQGEALRRVARGRREADAVRPPAMIEGAVQQSVPDDRTTTPGRRLIAGGLFVEPLALPGAEPSRAPQAVSTGDHRDPSLSSAPSTTTSPASAVDDVATRAISVVRRPGPVVAVDSAPARTLIMGILNVTLDSFSDGGRYARYDDAIAHARSLVADGADIIDVGGESTRPGAPRVDVREEQRRVIPVIRELVGLGFRISVDTMNAATAFAAVEAGADIINDVSGGLADPNMTQVVVDTDATYVAMHWRGHSDQMHSRAVYRDAVAEVKGELFQRVAELVVRGVDPDRIVIDPGLGFAKLGEHNWQLLGHLSELAEIGLPILVAASRKRFLGALLPEEAGVGERDPATAVISALSAQAGAWGVRVHDVASTRAALDVWDAWQKGSRA